MDEYIAKAELEKNQELSGKVPADDTYSLTNRNEVHESALRSDDGENESDFEGLNSDLEEYMSDEDSDDEEHLEEFDSDLEE